MKNILPFFIIALFFSRCNHNCSNYNYGKIIEVEKPEKAKANVVLPIEITVELDVSCESVHEVFESGFGNTKDIRVSILNNECECTQQYQKVKANYRFLQEYGGSYVLKYQSISSPAILDTITVDW